MIAYMPEDYQVKPGDCINSIAFEHGFFWESLWNHANNAGLKQKRKDPNVLMEGDVVHIPDLTLGQESAGTEERHRFRLKGVPAKLCLRLTDWENKPRKGVPYILTIDGISKTGKTDANGRIEEPIPPGACRAHLKVQNPDRVEEYDLPLGHLDPIAEDSGVVQRLTNLGYACGDETGIGEQTRVALKAFQARHSLAATGEADQTTRKKLQEVHGA